MATICQTWRKTRHMMSPPPVADLIVVTTKVIHHIFIDFLPTESWSKHSKINQLNWNFGTGTHLRKQLTAVKRKE